jgi:hypothetical protein
MPHGRKFLVDLSIRAIADRHHQGGRQHHPERRPEMNPVKREWEPATQSDLERVIEPLASYICATEEPRAALMTALAVLFNEVDRTFKSATAHIATFSGSQWS